MRTQNGGINIIKVKDTASKEKMSVAQYYYAFQVLEFYLKHLILNLFLKRFFLVGLRLVCFAMGWFLFG